MAAETKVYTLKEVEKHNTDNDVWMVIHDRVYDLTKFLNEVSSLYMHAAYFSFGGAINHQRLMVPLVVDVTQTG